MQARTEASPADGSAPAPGGAGELAPGSFPQATAPRNQGQVVLSAETADVTNKSMIL